ncbi:hypothetical protein B7494_g1091 [Chlorociboria aeruginascens]|nr:hypothetical protein B7494_g1091 [Chlorociboria aeruginascens]
MKFFAILVGLGAFVSSALAQSVSGIPSSDDCSGYVFSSTDIKNAAYSSLSSPLFFSLQLIPPSNEALSDLNSGKTQGSDDYPHQYEDYEDFDFPDCDSPYYEFPIFKGKTYSGGSPGADRVVIGSHNGKNAAFCGVITHYGASSENGFVGCTAE